MTGILVFFLLLAGVPAKQITTIAGTGKAGFSGDGGAGAAGEINNPYDL